MAEDTTPIAQGQQPATEPQQPVVASEEGK
jgi:hypothetical protein